MLFFFYDYQFTVKNTKYIPQVEIKNYLKSTFFRKSYFQVSTDSIEQKIKLKFEYVDKVKVEKSIFWGFIIDIKEFIPQAYIYFVSTNKTFMLTQDKKFLSISQIYEDVPVFNFIDLVDINDLSNFEDFLIRYVEKILVIYKDLNQYLGIMPIYFLDRFGNLIVETKNILIKFDLNERFYTMNKQLKLVITKANNINSNEKLEIDARYKYLIVRKSNNV